VKTTAAILADSVNEAGDRLTTLQVCFPRFILAEVNSLRVFSRNYRSSRAVPVDKLISEVRLDPFIPSQFTKNKPGMQGGAALSGEELVRARKTWELAASTAADFAVALARAGVHKQYANRGLEPYLYVHGVVSATDWDNFFALRCHPDAQPEFQELACAMRDAIQASKPTWRDASWGGAGDHHRNWHLPYVTDDERAALPLHLLKQASAARCAWVSYKAHDPTTDVTDLAKVTRTYERLILADPIHASPLEHQATPGYGSRSNYRGWDQHRHQVEAAPRHAVAL
jgi:thymidylate synthase ThyX